MNKVLIGKKIENIIHREGLTQTEFASKLGFSNTYISDIVRGQTKPSLELLQKIKYVFNVSTDWILTEDSAENTGSPLIKESTEDYTKTQIDNTLLRDAEIDELLEALVFRFRVREQSILDKYVKNHEKHMKGQQKSLKEIKELLVRLLDKK